MTSANADPVGVLSQGAAPETEPTLGDRQLEALTSAFHPGAELVDPADYVDLSA